LFGYSTFKIQQLKFAGDFGEDTQIKAAVSKVWGTALGGVTGCGYY
jgi:hypothetical protein